MIKKRVNRQFLIATIVMVGIMGIGCSHNQNDNMIVESREQSTGDVIEQNDISITNKSGTTSVELDK